MEKRPVFYHSLFMWKCCRFLVFYKLSINQGHVAGGKKLQFYAT